MVEDFIRRYVSKLGLQREVLNKAKDCKSPDEIVIYPLFGDLQSCVFTGQVLLPKTLNSKKYNIVLSWPGVSGVYAGIDEYWGLNPDFAYKSFHYQSDGLENNSTNYRVMMRSLNENFINVNELTDIKKIYKTHIKDEFKNIKDFSLNGFVCNPVTNLPYLKQGIKKAVVLIPWTNFKTIVEGKVQYQAMDSAVYLEIIKRLNYFGYTVYCVQNDWTYNFSTILNSAEVIYIKDNDIKNIISYINHVGCLFDYFSDFSILGYMAQVPTFSVVERNYFYTNNKDLEHYVMNFTDANQIIFSFNYFAKSDTGLNLNVINSIIDRFDDFYEKVSKNYIKVFHKEKNVKMAGYIEKRVQKYKPYFIAQIMKEKERIKNEKV